MTPNIEKFYPQIGQLANDAVTEAYSELWVQSETTDEASSVGIFFKRQDGSFHYINEDLDSLDDILFKMREAFKTEAKEPWSSVTFWMNESGKFSMHFGYEDVSDFGQALDRRAGWIRKYIGEDVKINYAP